ncbi:MAG: CDP-alcohol phosphatidyltransferase family protein [Isosphaeraceae bacterium]|nr:CDP-alcohol phosphatidyltransferase family protein [Isosphaeraceae bacterium]
MPRRSPRIVIDARPSGPAGALAVARVRGISVLERLVEQSRGLGCEPVVIDAPLEDHARLRGFVAEFDTGRYQFTSGERPPDGVVLRTDRLYDPSRLRRAVRAGRDPETAVIWRLDTPQGLAGAEQELVRRQSYQPLGRYWALAPARALARALAPTPVRPNALTLAAGGLMLVAAAMVAFIAPGIGVQSAVALALAAALVLDTADGHLARLQGTASEFGRWLDAYLDELADMALHAAIAWGAFVRDGQHSWLLLGMLYAMGKYQFVVATAESTRDGLDGDEARDDRGDQDSEAIVPPSALELTDRDLSEFGARATDQCATNLSLRERSDAERPGEGEQPHASAQRLQPDAPRPTSPRGRGDKPAPSPTQGSASGRQHKGGGDKDTRSALRGRHAAPFQAQLAAAIRLVGHADIRWHLWIILAAIGRLDGALAVYALYFPVRALAVAVKKGVRRA